MRPMKILVVDDERAVRESLRRALELEGYEVELAGDGYEAIARSPRRTSRTRSCSTCSCRAIDGLEVCRRLRRDGSTLRS